MVDLDFFPHHCMIPMYVTLDKRRNTGPILDRYLCLYGNRFGINICCYVVAHSLIVPESKHNFIFPWKWRVLVSWREMGSQDWQKRDRDEITGSCRGLKSPAVSGDEITGSWRGLKSPVVSGDLGSVGFFSGVGEASCEALSPVGAGISYKIKKHSSYWCLQQACDWSKCEPEKEEEEEEGMDGCSIKNHQSASMPHGVE